MTINSFFNKVSSILKEANIDFTVICSLLDEGKSHFIHITFNSNLTIAYSEHKATCLFTGDYYSQFLMMKNIKESDMALVLDQMKALCLELANTNKFAPIPFVYVLEPKENKWIDMRELNYQAQLEKLDLMTEQVHK